MKEFKCTKCNSKDVFISQSGNNTGLYCGDCGKWITWLNKDELRLAERFIAENRGKSLKILLEKLADSSISEVENACKDLGINLKDDNGNWLSTYDALTALSKVFE